MEYVKVPLMKRIISICMRYPEATKENTTRHNTHILIDIKDKFFEYEYNPGRDLLFKAAWKMLIAEYEHDPYYRHRFDWFIEKIKESDWEPRIKTRPSRDGLWNEPL